MENSNEPKKLLVKESNFKSDLSFNEWAAKFNVGTRYIEPTKYFQGNSTYRVEESETFMEALKRIFNIQI